MGGGERFCGILFILDGRLDGWRWGVGWSGSLGHGNNIIWFLVCGTEYWSLVPEFFFFFPFSLVILEGVGHGWGGRERGGERGVILFFFLPALS